MMLHYTHKKTGRRYLLLAQATDCTNSRDGTIVAIYCPDDNQHSIFVRDLSEFEAKFEPMVTN
jgi:hypothetical protein